MCPSLVPRAPPSPPRLPLTPTRHVVPASSLFLFAQTGCVRCVDIKTLCDGGAVFTLSPGRLYRCEESHAQVKGKSITIPGPLEAREGGNIPEVRLGPTQEKLAACPEAVPAVPLTCPAHHHRLVGLHA
ncbi:hypothetical protein E2C01_075237 [Portunus trituberculatus]|uniref:Uncharacterized protein n=1 Tax=Portunus trituberculatus TaxID=210409 RepID=A0A5B7IA78_PORTR|nr:hypothetical protein [Portunus trituberculatus]